MELGQNTNTLDDTRIGRLIRDNWLLAVAFHPLLRVIILAEPPAEMAGIQLAERFLWLSWWVLEAAVVIAASRDGFRVASFFRALSPMAQVLVAAWLTALVIATLRAEHFGLAVRSAFEWLVHGLFAMAAWHLAVHDRARFALSFDRLSVMLAWVTVVAGLAAMGLVYSIGISSDYPFGTDLPGFAHIRHSGYIFAPAMALCLGRLATRPDSPRVPMLLLVLNVALCLWFGSRGPFMGLLVGLAAAFALFPEFRRARFWLRSAWAGVAGVALSVIVPSPENGAFNAVRRFFNGSADPSEFSSGRTEFWKEAVGLIYERPLFGYGGGQFQFVSQLARNMYRHPHDFILQVMVDWGLLGGGAFVGLLALTGAIALKAQKGGDPLSRIGFFGATCMLGFALVDGILFYPYTIAVTVVFFTAALLPAAVQWQREASAVWRSGCPVRTSG